MRNNVNFFMRPAWLATFIVNKPPTNKLKLPNVIGVKILFKTSWQLKQPKFGNKIMLTLLTNPQISKILPIITNEILNFSSSIGTSLFSSGSSCIKVVQIIYIMILYYAYLPNLPHLATFRQEGQGQCNLGTANVIKKCVIIDITKAVDELVQL